MPKNPEPIHLLAPAKLNLYLHVLGRSGDYHRLESLVAFTKFGDRLEVCPGTELTLRIEGPFAAQCGPIDENLVMRAARALASYAAVPAGAEFTLYKNLPVASGLGGGSSDGAAAIRLLIQLWDLKIDGPALAELALRLGADVPVCLRAAPTIMRGIGDKLKDAPELPDCYVLLVNPGVELPTKAVFEKLNGRFGQISQPLTCQILDTKKMLCLLNARRNDLQSPAIELVPEIEAVLDTLSARKGCLLARMSGSGPTCFGLFASAEEMAAAAIAIKDEQPAYWLAQTRLA